MGIGGGWIQDFPLGVPTFVGGADLRCRHFLAKSCKNDRIGSDWMKGRSKFLYVDPPLGDFIETMKILLHYLNHSEDIFSCNVASLFVSGIYLVIFKGVGPLGLSQCPCVCSTLYMYGFFVIYPILVSDPNFPINIQYDVN